MATTSGLTSLLSWATQNTARDPDNPDIVAPQPIKNLDPGIIDLILGKPDSVRMKEALAVASDESKSQDDRVQALDDLEMLIESLDNANYMEVLKMWDPILSLASSKIPEIATQALWVAGTAIQNNPKSQAAFLAHQPFPSLIAALSSNSSPEVRAKAMYCISGALKHNHAGVRQFTTGGGWVALKEALSDSSIVVRRKVAFLLNVLLIPTSEPSAPSSSEAEPTIDTSELTRAALTYDDIVSILTSTLVSPIPLASGDEGDLHDADYEEKAMRTVITYLQGEDVGTKIDEEGSVKRDVKKLLVLKDTERGRSWGLDEADWTVLEQHAQD